jgi:hypothetical protein
MHAGSRYCDNCSYLEFRLRILENGVFNETESMNRQHEIEPYWQDEDDWLCTVEFLPSNDPEGRVFAADIVG